MSVEKLSSFLKNYTTDQQHKPSDAELAGFLAHVKLTERLDDKTVESLASDLRLGAKSTAALHKLRDQSQSLAAAAPAAPVEAPRPIPIPSAEEQGKILQDVREYALSYSKNLPDFICTEREQRYGAPPVRAGSPDWRKIDELTKRLSYFEQREDYKLIMRNSQIVSNQDVKSAGGSQSFGDFGSMMREIFEPNSQAHFEWDHWGTLRGRRVMAFSYRVAQSRSQWHLVFEKKMDIVPAYHGLVYVDNKTHEVMRVTLEAENIPADFPIKRADTVLDYDFQELSGKTFLLPLKSTTIMAASDYLTKNDEEFRVYRKYSAESDIKFDSADVPAPLPEEKTKETPMKKEENSKETPIKKQ